MFLLVEPVWCCRKQWQERGIESLGGALRSHLLHSCSLTAPCGQKHPVRATGGGQGLCGQGQVRALDGAGNRGTSLCPWPVGCLSPRLHPTLPAGTESSLRASSLQAIRTQGNGQSFLLTLPSLNTFSPWRPAPSLISHPRRHNFVELKLLLVSSSQKD